MIRCSFLLLVLVAVNARCVACSGPLAFSAVSVTIVDADTGESLIPGSTVTISNGSSAEVITLPLDATITAVHSEFRTPGVYSVAVSHPGYHDWSQDNIEVAREPQVCGSTVQAVTIHAAIERVLE